MVYVSAKEAAKLAGVSPATLYRAIWRGELAARRRGRRGRYLLLTADVLRWAGRSDG